MNLEDPSVQALVLGYVPIAHLRGRLELYFGPSRHLAVLRAFLREREFSLESLRQELGAGERAVRGSGTGRPGWLRATVDYYRARGLLEERRCGRRVVYSLNDASVDGLFLRLMYRPIDGSQ